MHLVIPFAIIVGLAIVAPKGFKYIAGTLVGIPAGGLAWALAACITSVVFTVPVFAAFIIMGIVGGCIVCAK